MSDPIQEQQRGDDTHQPMVRCWIVLRDYDYEGKEVVAVFNCDVAAIEFAGKQHKSTYSRCVVEEWPIISAPNTSVSGPRRGAGTENGLVGGTIQEDK